MIYLIIPRYVPSLKRGIQSTRNKSYFHGRFSVLSAFRSPFKLKISKSIVHKGSMIEVIIPINCFIYFHCALVHCVTPSQFINKGEYHYNTRAFVIIVENSFKFENEITVELEGHVRIIKTCNVCSNNKYATLEDNCTLINLRLVKK